MVGIVSYGFYLPKYRIKIEEIAKTWGKNPNDVKKSLMIEEKTVASVDEDCLTMAFEASSLALKNFPQKTNIKAVFFGSETSPYAVNPASTILAEFLGIEEEYLASDCQFACKASTGAIISALGLINSGFTDYALVVAGDKAAAKPHDVLEYTVASGAVSLLLGKNHVVVELIDWLSFSSDTPDFWRRDGIRYPSHGGRFTGKPAYFYHIKEASKRLLKKLKMKPTDFKFAVFHMPNGKFPLQIGYSLGFVKSQLEPGYLAPFLGNSYTASSLLGLVAVLEKAEENDLIFLASYGSGAGSDAFVFRVNKDLKKKRIGFWEKVNDKKYIDYPTYLKFMTML